MFISLYFTHLFLIAVQRYLMKYNRNHCWCMVMSCDQMQCRITIYWLLVNCLKMWQSSNIWEQW